jgi:hypothetical protein
MVVSSSNVLTIFRRCTLPAPSSIAARLLQVQQGREQRIFGVVPRPGVGDVVDDPRDLRFAVPVGTAPQVCQPEPVRQILDVGRSGPRARRSGVSGQVRPTPDALRDN